MIKYFSSLLNLFFMLNFSVTVFGQCDGDITLSSQEDVDNFAVDYGCSVIDGNLSILGYNDTISDLLGLSNITSISGELNINGNTITDLSGLSNIISVGGINISNNYYLTDLSGLLNITYVSGNLIFNTNNSLTNLSGLQNLISIGGKFQIYNNDALADLTDLADLNFIGEDLELFDNDILTDLLALQNLTAVNGHLRIQNNDALTNLSGLQNITTIGGVLWISDNDALSSLSALQNLMSIEYYIRISGNNSLTDLSGLQNLTNTESHLEIIGNGSLTNLSGLDNIITVNGVLIIEDNDALTNLSGLENLTNIENWLEIKGNGFLTDLSGLENLTNIVGYLEIKGNGFLTDLSGLENLTNIVGYLEIGGNGSLTDLSGLENLTDIGGSLIISGNNSLTDLSGLENLTNIGGWLRIASNDVLTNISGLENLTNVGSWLLFDNNDSLTDLSGLQNLTNIGSWLGLSSNDALTDLSGLQSLTNIEGDLNLSSNDALTDLSGLSNITSVGEDLKIWFNDALTDLSGLHNIITVGKNIVISNNGSLTDLSDLANIITVEEDLIIENNSILNICCEAQCIAVVTQGAVTIQNNATGCNSLEEIESNCTEIECANLEITPSFTITGTCETSPTIFTNNTQGTATQFEWDFGDGTTMTTTSVNDPIEHTYEVGTYPVTLTAIAPDGQEYEYSETINVFTTYKLNINPLDVNIGGEQYNVRRYATVHHHLKITDLLGEPIEGISIRYKVFGGDLSDEIFESEVSDENGIVDLNIKVSGEDLESLEDDPININSTAGTVSYYDVIIPESSLNAYCEDIEILENNFENFNIAVGEYLPSKKSYGLFGKYGYFASVQSDPETTFAEIEGGGNLKATVGARLTLENEYDAFNLLSKSHFTISGNLAGTGEIEGSATFNAGLGEQIMDYMMLPQKSVDASIGLNLNAFVTGEIDYEQQFSVEDQSLYMFYTYLELTSLGFSSSATYFLRESIGKYFQNLDDVPLTLSYGGNASILLKASGQLGVFPFENEFLGINLDASSLGENAIYTIGFKNQLLNGTPTFKASYGTFSSHVYSPIDLDLELFNLGVNFTSPYEKGRGLEVSGYLDKINFEPLGGEMVFTNTDFKNVNNIKRDIDYTSTFKFNQSAINRVLVNNTAPFFSNSYLLGSSLNSLMETNEALFASEVNEVIQSSIFDSAIESNSVQLKIDKTYEWEVGFELDVPLGKLGAGPIKWGKTGEFGVFNEIKYPLAEFYNSAESDELLPFVTYPDDESFVDLWFDDFNIWWSQTQNYLLDKADQIVESAATFVWTAITTIQDAYVNIFNDYRSPVSGKNGKTVSFEDFSILTFSYPNDGTVFSEGTEVSLNYFYPKGEVGGITVDSSEFVVISDVFYLSAQTGTDTLDAAQNGNFNINIVLGQDDLEYLGLPTDAIVELFFKKYDELFWQSIKIGDGDVPFNLTGEFALGTRLERENISPMVQFNNTDSFEDDGYISATLQDNESGIDWSTVMFLVNDSIFPYTRVEFTNEIRIDSDLLTSGLFGEKTLYVQGYDLQRNLGFDVAIVDLNTGIDVIQTFNHFIILYPNPASHSVFLKLNTKGDENLSYMITDVTGKIIANDKLINQGYGLFNYEVDILALPVGVYEFTLNIDGTKQETRKFVVEK